MPICQTCSTAGIKCHGYSKAVVFTACQDKKKSQNEGVDGFRCQYRRPLMDEDEQRRMCRGLVAEVPPHLSLWHINKIDEECEGSAEAAEVQVNRGPFGAFRFESRLLIQPTEQESPERLEDETTCTRQEDGSPEVGQEGPVLEHENELQIDPHLGDHDVDELRDGISFGDGTVPIISDGTIVPSVRGSPLCSTSQSLSWSGQLPGEGFFGSVFPWEMDIPPVSDLFIQSCLPPLPEDGVTSTPSLDNHAEEQSPMGKNDRANTDILCLPFIIPLQGIQPAVPSSVPKDAVTLLQHYTANVLPMFTPYRHAKTPWHVLFVPHCKTTLASLTMSEQVDHASLCSLHGTLAISAISLGSVCVQERTQSSWLERARNHIAVAESHAQSMLLSAYQVPKAIKYKSILVALLTMVQAFFAIGDSNKVDTYFLQAETFIRLKGLPKRRKSRKVRLLHHCYAFERAQYESTLHMGNAPNRQPYFLEAAEKAAVEVDGNDLHCWNSDDVDGRMLRVKGTEEGENDLHLEIPGIWPATLYPEIFGLAETQMAMLWNVIRLAKEREKSDSQERGLGVKGFMNRAKSLERWIISLAQNHVETSCYLPEQSDDQGQPLQRRTQALPEITLEAMGSALRMYFYRRIYDVDPSLLQRDATYIRDCLLRSEQIAGENGGLGYFTLAWPAFVAACEAQDAALRAFFAAWFEKVQRRSGSRLFSDKLAKVEAIWMATSVY